jgi:hypothetical protein
MFEKDSGIVFCPLFIESGICHNETAYDKKDIDTDKAPL